jgi:hypothetical protein
MQTVAARIAYSWSTMLHPVPSAELESGASRDRAVPLPL